MSGQRLNYGPRFGPEAQERVGVPAVSFGVTSATGSDFARLGRIWHEILAPALQGHATPLSSTAIYRLVQSQVSGRQAVKFALSYARSRHWVVESFQCAVGKDGKRKPGLPPVSYYALPPAPEI